MVGGRSPVKGPVEGGTVGGTDTQVEPTCPFSVFCVKTFLKDELCSVYLSC
jgi:hypothetical protein